jgi:hypothetical protein
MPHASVIRAREIIQRSEAREFRDAAESRERRQRLALGDADDEWQTPDASKKHLVVTKSFASDDVTDDDPETTSRNAWIRSQRLRPPRSSAPAATTMDAATQRAWDDWATRLIDNKACQLRLETQAFVGNLVRENNRNLMKVINTLHDEIDQLRTQLKEMKDA